MKELVYPMRLPTHYGNHLLLTALLLLVGTALSAQVITGRIINEFSEPLPYANIYVQQLQTGTVSDDAGRYELRLDVEGEYNLVFSSLGYESRSERVLLVGDTAWVNVQLHTSAVELEELVVSASEKDPAFGIIKKVIAHKDRQLRAADSYRAKIYLKAVEETEEQQKQEAAAPVEVDLSVPNADPFAAEQAAQQALLDGLNLVEMEVVLNYQQPRRYKEERTAYQAYGRKDGLFIPIFAETDFNFYRNLVYLPGISDAPVISPLSNNAILSYKYELEEAFMEGQRMVNKIKVIPRKEGNSTVRGTLWIVEDEWTIQKLELELPVGTLLFGDNFRIEQQYQQMDSLWIVERQAFHYMTKQGKKRVFKGSTVLRYSDYQHNYRFPEKFFGNEVAVTTSEAYQRDGQYWANTRTEALAAREAELIHIRDSIQAVHNSPAYRDSLEGMYNQVNLLEIAWDGIGIRNWRDQSHLYVGSLASMIDFSPVGGWRVSPYVSRFKRYKSGRILSNSGSLSYGIKNQDLQGNFSSWFRYDPFRLGDISMSGGRSFETVNQFDAYLNQLRPSNYILRDAFRLRHHIELFNGFRIHSSFGIDDRKPITGYDVSSFLGGVVSDGDELLDFERYQAFITTNTISYTPRQRYMREPNRKVILGSKWPTFSVTHRRGWDKALSSDIRFDYFEAAIEQKVILGPMGNTHYRAQLGQFTNTDDLRFVDFKQFRESDPILYSDPLRTFQMMDTSLTTTNLHFELHFIHHFNGAIINNIPLLKKTRIKAVAGGGFLWLKDNDYRHQEVFVGVERVFKIGPRRRLRVGLFGVAADANNRKPDTSFKISFDLIDIWKRDWSF